MLTITLSFAPTASAMSTRMSRERRPPPPPVYIPTPTLEIGVWWILKDKAPDHDEVDEDVEDGKDEEAVVQVLESAAAA